MHRILGLALILALILSPIGDAQTFPAFQWVAQLDNSKTGTLAGVGTDSSGNVYAAGSTKSSTFAVRFAVQNRIASAGHSDRKSVV